MNNTDNIESIIGYNFKDKNLLNIALTHSSYSNETGELSYERLEFLGDAVIELFVSEYIYGIDDYDAGTLTRLRASLVSTENLKKISNSMGFPEFVKKSKSLVKLSDKNSADIVESIVGAIFLDGGQECAKRFIYENIIISKDNIIDMLNSSIDYKTKLQELMQAKGETFEYRLIDSFGPDNDKTFKVELIVNGEIVAVSTGKSKQLAELSCAKEYLSKI